MLRSHSLRAAGILFLCSFAACGRTDFGADLPSSTRPTDLCPAEIKRGANTPTRLHFVGGELFWFELDGNSFDNSLFRHRPCTGEQPVRVGPACCLGANSTLAYWADGSIIRVSDGTWVRNVFRGPAWPLAVDDGAVYTRALHDDVDKLVRIPRDGNPGRAIGQAQTEGVIGVHDGFVFDLTPVNSISPVVRRMTSEGREETIFYGSAIQQKFRMGPDAIYAWGFERFDQRRIESRLVRIDRETGEQKARLTVERELIDDVVITEDTIWFSRSSAIWRMDRERGGPTRVIEVSPGTISIALSHDTLYWASTGWTGDVVLERSGTIGRVRLDELR